MESLVHRIQHGNNKRADEAKLYHKIRNAKDTMEIINAEPSEPEDDPSTWWRYGRWRRPAIDKRYKQHQLKVIGCIPL